MIAGPQVSVPAGALRIDPVWSQDEIQNGAPDGVALIDGVTHTLLDSATDWVACGTVTPGAVNVP